MTPSPGSPIPISRCRIQFPPACFYIGQQVMLRQPIQAPDPYPDQGTIIGLYYDTDRQAWRYILDIMILSDSLQLTREELMGCPYRLEDSIPLSFIAATRQPRYRIGQAVYTINDTDTPLTILGLLWLGFWFYRVEGHRWLGLVEQHLVPILGDGETGS